MPLAAVAVDGADDDEVGIAGDEVVAPAAPPEAAPGEHAGEDQPSRPAEERRDDQGDAENRQHDAAVDRRVEVPPVGLLADDRDSSEHQQRRHGERAEERRRPRRPTGRCGAGRFQGGAWLVRTCTCTCTGRQRGN